MLYLLIVIKKLEKKLKKQLIIYKYNLNLTLLLLHKNLIYYIQNYNNNLETFYLRLSQKDKIKNLLKLKNRQFINF